MLRTGSAAVHILRVLLASELMTPDSAEFRRILRVETWATVPGL